MDEQTPLRGLPQPEEPHSDEPSGDTETYSADSTASAAADDTRFSAPVGDTDVHPMEWGAITPPSGVTPVSGTAGLDSLDDLDFTLPSQHTDAGPTPEHPNRGRARERIAKRKGAPSPSTSTRSTRPPAVRNAPPRERVARDPSSVVTRGINSARSAARSAMQGRTRTAGTTDPSFRLPITRTGLYLIGSAIFVVVVVVLIGVVRNRPVDALPNALFIGTEWTYEDQTEDSIRALTDRLKDNQIGVVYAWVSWLQTDNTWRGEANFEKVQNFVRLFREFYPQADLYGWVSFPVNANGIDRMGDAAVQQTVGDFSKRVIDEFGFDGVFLNAEPVWNGDADFLALLRTIRRTIGDTALISAAVPPDWSPIGTGIPVPALIVPGTVWESDYKQNVALLVDQLVVMAYNSGLTTPSDYTQWMAYQVSTYANTIADLGAGTQVLIGIPTYDAEPPGHDPQVENVLTAIEGVKLGLEEAGETKTSVRGVALYAGWETDDQEWNDFMNSWVRGS